MTAIEAVAETDAAFDASFHLLVQDLYREQVVPQSGQTRTRRLNMLDTYMHAPEIQELAHTFFEKQAMGADSRYTASFKNITVYMAQYIQLGTREPGINRIAYPNDLMNAFITAVGSDARFREVIAAYCGAGHHRGSDVDFVRVFEFTALHHAMNALNLIHSPDSTPFEQSGNSAEHAYFQTAREHAAEIAEYLQITPWSEIIQAQKDDNWNTFGYVLDREYTFKTTYPERYTDLLRHIITRVDEKGLLPEGKLSAWLVGAGDAPELSAIVQMLGEDRIESVFATDLYGPEIPFPMVKSIFDGQPQGDPATLIMDPKHYLAEHGWPEYVSGLDICDAATIPAEIQDIDVSTMLAVLLHIDGQSDTQKLQYKRAIQNWVARGKPGAVFIAFQLKKAYQDIPVMVLRKIESTDETVQALVANPTTKLVFTETLNDGTPVWTPEEIKALGVEAIIPDDNDMQFIGATGVTWANRFINDQQRRAK